MFTDNVNRKQRQVRYWFPLEKPGFMRILLMLVERPPLTVSAVHDKVGGSLSTLESRVNELVRLGLISEERTVDSRHARLLSLTKLGREVTYHIGYVSIEIGLKDPEVSWFIQSLMSRKDRIMRRLRKPIF